MTGHQAGDGHPGGRALRLDQLDQYRGLHADQQCAGHCPRRLGSAIWNALKADVAAAIGDQKKLQSPTLRGFAHNNNASSISSWMELLGPKIHGAFRGYYSCTRGEQ